MSRKGEAGVIDGVMDSVLPHDKQLDLTFHVPSLFPKTRPLPTAGSGVLE